MSDFTSTRADAADALGKATGCSETTNRNVGAKSLHAHERRNGTPPLAREVADEILRAIAAIRYGSVEVVVHAGRVVQIEVREKRRFDAPAGATG